MEAKVNFAVVGVFVLVLGAGLIAGVLWFSSGGTYRKAYDTYQTNMAESVSGLSLDAPVRYRGVEVGRVRKMALAPANVQLVQLTLDIERGTPVKQDTVAVLRVQGLTGIAYVELSGDSPDSPALEAKPGEAYPVIRSGPSLMVRLDSAVSALLTNANRTSMSMNALMDEDNRHAFKQTLAELQVLSRTLAARSAAIDSALVNTARTMDNAARISGDLPRLVERMSSDLPRLVERLQASADRFDRMSSDVAQAGTGVRADLRQATGEILPEVRMLAADLREVTATLRRFSEQLEQNPSMLLYGKTASRPGPGE
jgi:phospholipid/cholesterol/gamma-HCH transport system substrate-binding protein